MAGLLCLAIIAAVHLSYIANGFIWLDHGDIENGRAIIPLAQWWVAFAKPLAATGFYRPLVTLLHSLDASLWTSWAPGFHLTSIALHCAAAFAAPLFIGCFLPLSPFERCAVVLAVGLHPLGMLPAGAISFRSEPLMALFTFLAVWSYAKARSGNGRRWLAAAFFSTALACFSKETACFYIPLFLALWEIIRFACSARGSSGMPPANRATAAVSALPLILKLAPAVVTATAIGSVVCLRLCAVPRLWRITAAPLPFFEGIATRLSVIGIHLVNLVSPLPPRLGDAVSIVGMGNPGAVAVAVALIAAVGLMLRRGFSFQGTAMLLLLGIGLFPALTILPLPRFYSPHYAYVAVAPVAGIVILLVRAVRHRFGPAAERGFSALALTWLLVAALSTAIWGGRFKSDLTFFGPEVARDQRFLEGWFYLGNYYRDRGNLDEAWQAYQKGLLSGPGFIAFIDRPEVLINQSAVAIWRNDLASADSLMLLARACAPPYLQPDITCNRAFIAGRRGDWDTVIALLAGKEENLQRPQACFILAAALRQRGYEKESREMNQRALKLQAADRRYTQRHK